MGCNDLHHEIELGVIINKTCKRVSKEDAMNYVGGYCLALDMTARDFQVMILQSLAVALKEPSIQNEAKAKGAPWTMAKMFDTSCPVSSFIPVSSIPDPANVELWCKVNGEARQSGNTKDMIFSVPTLISFISDYFTLEEGDLVLTGTDQSEHSIPRIDQSETSFLFIEIIAQVLK